MTKCKVLTGSAARGLIELWFFCAEVLAYISYFSVSVTFVTRLGVHSIVFVRRLSNEACETLTKLLFRILLYWYCRH